MKRSCIQVLFFIVALNSYSFSTSSEDKTIERSIVEFTGELKLLTFNIWQEGTQVTNGFEKIQEVIIKVDPDIVCFTEVRNYKNKNWTAKFVNVLRKKGYTHYTNSNDGDVSLMSKFPITGSTLVYSGEGSIVNFEVDLNGKPIIVSCAHLDYTYYACYLPRGYNGGSPNWSIRANSDGEPIPITAVSEIEAYNLKSERDEQMNAFLESVQNEKRPIILMGDFNEPSHLDWTSKTAELFDHSGVEIKWSTTQTLFNAGYTDAFREYFPNEVLNPGITWPSFAHGKNSTSWTPKSDERDRIDYIFYKGNGIRTINASLVGPKKSYAYGQVVTSYTSNENFIADEIEWPSDHKGILVTLLFE